MGSSFMLENVALAVCGDVAGRNLAYAWSKMNVSAISSTMSMFVVVAESQPVAAVAVFRYGGDVIRGVWRDTET